MAKTFELDITNTLDAGLKKYFNKVGISKNAPKGADLIARKLLGLQILNWTLNGSAREGVTPPIKWGILRGSGSVFVASKLVTTSEKGSVDKYGNAETPNRSFNGPRDQITIGFNTAYAAKMHEGFWKPGEASRLAGNTGRKFLEKHLSADAKDMSNIYAAELKARSGG